MGVWKGVAAGQRVASPCGHTAWAPAAEANPAVPAPGQPAPITTSHLQLQGRPVTWRSVQKRWPSPPQSVGGYICLPTGPRAKTATLVLELNWPQATCPQASTATWAGPPLSQVPPPPPCPGLPPLQAQKCAQMVLQLEVTGVPRELVNPGRPAPSPQSSPSSRSGGPRNMPFSREPR